MNTARRSRIRMNTPRRMYLRVVRGTLSGMLLLGLAQQANAGSVKDCAQEHIALHQRLVQGMPADPSSGQAALKLWRDGLELCGKGDSSAGRAKLQDATSQLDRMAPAIPK